MMVTPTEPLRAMMLPAPAAVPPMRVLVAVDWTRIPTDWTVPKAVLVVAPRPMRLPSSTVPHGISTDEDASVLASLPEIHVACTRRGATDLNVGHGTQVQHDTHRPLASAVSPPMSTPT